MAINKTIFTGTTAQTNAAEVTSWLQENATEYFASIVNESNIITCTVQGGGQLIIKPADRYWTIILKNGTSTDIDHSNSSNIVNQAFVTSKGIALYSQSKMWIFITKSNEGTIGVVFNTFNSDTNIGFADFSKSTSFDTGSLSHVQMSMTSLCACPLGDSGTYGEGLYFVPFYEYNSSGLIYVNGKSYVYSVFMALEE